MSTIMRSEPFYNVVKLFADLPIDRDLIEKKERQRRTNAWLHFVHGVSIAGLVELYHASYKAVRILWITALLAALASILFHGHQLISGYYYQKPAFQVIPTSKLTIPFPNITACVPAGINKTFALENLIIPPRVKKIIDKFDQEKRQQFIDQSIAFVSYSMENLADLTFTAASPLYREYHEVTTSTNDGYPGGAQVFTHHSVAQCQHTLTNCFFAGMPYNCCQNSVMKLADNGPCFEMPMNDVDASLNFPRSESAPVSYQFDLLMDWKHIPFYSSSATDGFSVHVADPWSLFGSPVSVPSGMHMHIDLSRPAFKIGRTKCTNEKKLPLTGHGPYDAKGTNCKMQRVTEMVFPKHIFGCQFSMGSFMPNDSVACTGVTELPFKILLAIGSGLNDIDHVKMDTEVRNDIHAAFHSNEFCPPMCSQWQYEPKIGYSQFVHISDPGGRGIPEVSRSRVTVFIGSPYYDQRTETPLVPFYTTFVDIGYVMALYGGFSVITLAEILFYGVGVCCAYKRKKNNKVAACPSTVRVIAKT